MDCPLPSFSKAMSWLLCHLLASEKFSCTKMLLTRICFLEKINWWKHLYLLLVINFGLKKPFGLWGVPPVVQAEHDGEGRSGQQDLVVFVAVKAMGCCERNSISDLGWKMWRTQDCKKKSYTYQYSATLAVDVTVINVFISQKSCNPWVGILLFIWKDVYKSQNTI